MTAPASAFRGRLARTAAIAILLAVVVAPFQPWSVWTVIAADPPPVVDGHQPFSHWPKDQRPEIVLVLSGQTYGYLSPCGCSRPQKGGLERRANLMDELRAKGWSVVGLDLGDVCPPKDTAYAHAKRVPEQDLLKYKTAMMAMKAMGYAAVGVGDSDVNQELYSLLGEGLNNPHPLVLASNLLGAPAAPGGAVTPREQKFTAGPNARPMVEDIEVIVKDSAGIKCLPVGVAGAIGPGVGKKIVEIDKQFVVGEAGESLKACVAKLQAHEAKPAVNALLFAGSLDEATVIAKAQPAFNLILCQIQETEPSQFPTMENDGKTMIVQVGHKGQNVGVVGVFKTTTGYELKYQLVPLGEQYLTPKEKVDGNNTLKLLEFYTGKVKENNLLAKFVDKPLDHPAMLQAGKLNPPATLTYVGAEKCKECHPQEGKIWSASRHSHAYESIEKATNPGNRQFDGDCVSCHSTGFGLKSGFRNAVDTPNLKHNGCENCHGPGSGHSADPKNKDYLAWMKPWVTQPGDKLPSKEVLEQLAKLDGPRPQITPREQVTMTAVSRMCMKCHDGENDPKFDLNVYFPKIWHSGFKAAGGAGLPGIAK